MQYKRGLTARVARLALAVSLVVSSSVSFVHAADLLWMIQSDQKAAVEFGKDSPILVLPYGPDLVRSPMEDLRKVAREFASAGYAQVRLCANCVMPEVSEDSYYVLLMTMQTDEESSSDVPLKSDQATSVECRSSRDSVSCKEGATRRRVIGSRTVRTTYRTWRVDMFLARPEPASEDDSSELFDRVDKYHIGASLTGELTANVCTDTEAFEYIVSQLVREFDPDDPIDERAEVTSRSAGCSGAR
jgi:hypothetical protein